MRKRNNLNADQKRAIAERVRAGAHIKQVASDWKVSPMYVYRIINELLEWKLEWRMKE